MSLVFAIQHPKHEKSLWETQKTMDAISEKSKRGFRSRIKDKLEERKSFRKT